MEIINLEEEMFSISLTINSKKECREYDVKVMNCEYDYIVRKIEEVLNPLICKNVHWFYKYEGGKEE